MKWRPTLIAVLVTVMAAAIGAQLWVFASQRETRARRQALHQDELARWQALPRGPGNIVPPQPHYYELPNPPPIILWQAPMFIALLAGAAHGQKKKKEREAEEEARTTYAEDDLMADWEFKIIRSPIGLFSRPAFLARILAEEQAGGWRFVEKFDGSLVRLKRPAGSMAAAAGPDGYDPLRTVIGPRSRGYQTLWVMAGVLLAIAIVAAVHILTDPKATATAAVFGGVAAVGAAALGWMAVATQAKFRQLVG